MHLILANYGLNIIQQIKTPWLIDQWFPNSTYIQIFFHMIAKPFLEFSIFRAFSQLDPKGSFSHHFLVFLFFNEQNFTQGTRIV